MTRKKLVIGVKELKAELDSLTEFKKNVFTEKEHLYVKCAHWQLGIDGHGNMCLRRNGKTVRSSIQLTGIVQDWLELKNGTTVDFSK